MVFIEIIEKLNRKRYLDNDELTESEERLLQSLPTVVIEEYNDSERTYTLCGLNYK